MICKHECPICGNEYEHLCDTPPKEPIAIILLLAYGIDYMPPCNKEDYLLECASCIIQKEIWR